MPPVVTSDILLDFLLAGIHAQTQTGRWDTGFTHVDAVCSENNTTVFFQSLIRMSDKIRGGAHYTGAGSLQPPQRCICENKSLFFSPVPLVSSGRTMGGMRSGSSSSPVCSPVARRRLRSRKSGTSMAKSEQNDENTSTQDTEVIR